MVVSNRIMIAMEQKYTFETVIILQSSHFVLFLMTILTRGCTRHTFEDFDKIIIVHKTDLVANLVHRPIGIRQVLDRFVNACSMQIMNQRLPGLLLNRALT